MKRCLLICLALGMLLPLTTAQAAERKLLIVVMDNVTWQDLRAEGVEAPTFWQLARKSAVGAMCVRTAGVEGEGSYLTLGAGARAAAPPSLFPPRFPEGYAFDSDEWVEGERAATAFRALTGQAPGVSRVLHLGLGEIWQQNLDLSYPLHLGLLGGTLTRAGLRVACLGNADTARSLHREIAALAMDGQGRVALGEVGSEMRQRDDSVPYRYTTNSRRLLSAFDRVSRQADVVIVDLGDTSRAEEYASLVTPAQRPALRARAIARADRTLTGLLRRAPRATWAVLLLAPNAPAPTPGRTFAALTPILLALPEGGPGLLTSPSTRRPGLVVNTDLAATVLQYFGLPVPSETFGRPITPQPASGDALASLTHDLERQDALEAVRRPIFRGFATFAAVALWLCVALLLLGEAVPRWARSLGRGLLLLALAAPSASLLLGAYPDPLPALKFGGALLGFTLLVSLLASAGAQGRAGDAVLAGMVVMLLVADLLLGQRMLHWSPLSYSVSAGARFYGLGNEYAGALLGGALVTAAALLPAPRSESRAGRALLALLLLGLTAAVGWPSLGANFGMALSCALAFLIFAVYLLRHQFSWVDALVLPLALVGLAVIIVVADLFLTQGKAVSHVGRLVEEIRAQGPGPLLDAIVRKLSMSFLLLRTSLWTDLALGALALLVTAIVTRPRALFAALGERPWLTPAVISAVVGAAAAILFNDSGILAAAMVLLYAAGAIAYLALAQPEPRPTPARSTAGNQDTRLPAPPN